MIRLAPLVLLPSCYPVGHPVPSWYVLGDPDTELPWPGGYEAPVLRSDHTARRQNGGCYHLSIRCGANKRLFVYVSCRLDPSWSVCDNFDPGPGRASDSVTSGSVTSDGERWLKMSHESIRLAFI